MLYVPGHADFSLPHASLLLHWHWNSAFVAPMPPRSEDQGLRGSRNRARLNIFVVLDRDPQRGMVAGEGDKRGSSSSCENSNYLLSLPRII